MIGRLSIPVAVLAALVSATAAAQSYGLGDQTLTIGADAFRPGGSDCAIATDVYGYIQVPDCGLFAPLSLPEGARVTQMCAYFNDPDAPSFGYAGLERILLPAGGQAPARILIDGSYLSVDFDIRLRNRLHGLARPRRAIDRRFRASDLSRVRDHRRKRDVRWGTHHLAPAGQPASRGVVLRRSGRVTVLAVHRGAQGGEDHGRLPGKPAALLPGPTHHAGGDGRVPLARARSALGELRAPPAARTPPLEATQAQNSPARGMSTSSVGQR